MKNLTLAQSYLMKARTRLKILRVLYDEGVHDVGDLLVEYRDKLPPHVSEEAERLREISRWLRKEREFALYGEADLIPTLEYSSSDAVRAMDDAETAVRAAAECIALPNVEP